MYSQDLHSRFLRMLITFLVLILISALCVGLLGCGNAEKSLEQNSMPQTESQTTTGPNQQTAPTTATTNTQQPKPNGISWNEAKYHIGERTTVYGPVASTKWATGSRGQPTFINLGNAYPSPNRFTVIIWAENRGNFPFAPESHYSGKTISVTGLITSYEGIPQIEVTSPSQIQEW